ncbi:MAG: adenine phosphoribosyltransferase [Elusimicrobiota bacterium]|jgi:adenine phosphoribosyltransferase
MNASADLRKHVRDVPDFPKKGIVFKDISPLLADPRAFAAAIDALAAPFKDRGVRYVAGIESRGFLFAAALAARLDAGILLIRKKGKLPCKTVSATYALEYGTDTIEIHADAAPKGSSVLVVDDVLATGGTAKAACELIEKMGAKVAGAAFLIELEFLKGREKLSGLSAHSVLRY